MGEIKPKLPVMLMVAAFAEDEKSLRWGKETAIRDFGPIRFESELFRFDEFTKYYEASMGTVLFKQLWGFENLVSPEVLAAVKVTTNRREEEFAQFLKEKSGVGVMRPLNLDPGYIDLGKLILASTKDHSHRIYLRDGIFAELTLIYTNKAWKSLPWTYPDYQSAEYHHFFDQCRDYLHRQLKQKTVN